MSNWYYQREGGGRAGPVSAAALRAEVEAGRLDMRSLAWPEGASHALPISEHAAALGLGAAPPAAVAPAAPAQAHSPYAAPQAPVYDASREFDPTTAGEVVYAGFWRRWAALAIDLTLVSLAYYIVLIAAIFVFGIGGAMQSTDSATDLTGGALVGLLGAVYLVYPLISGLYYVGMESSASQATLGKMATGIKVTDRDGRRLSRTHALGRWCSHLLCYITLYIGYIMAGFTERKRGLHDMAAGTLVVDRWAFTASPQRQQQGLGVVAIVVIVLSLLAMVAYLAILAAIALPAYQQYVERAAGAG